jgi:arylsulfatase
MHVWTHLKKKTEGRTGTDNGAEIVSWPEGGCTPFHAEKGTTWEGGHRVPLLLRWPGVIKPGTQVNEIIAHND